MCGMGFADSGVKLSQFFRKLKPCNFGIFGWKSDRYNRDRNRDSKSLRLGLSKQLDHGGTSDAVRGGTDRGVVGRKSSGGRNQEIKSHELFLDSKIGWSEQFFVREIDDKNHAVLLDINDFDANESETE